MMKINDPRTGGVLAVVLILFLVTGCANIKDDGTRTRAEGAGTGAAVGAAVGALVGQILGNDTGSTLAGAAIGAALGGVGGYMYGSHVADEKAKYASTEDWLNASIAQARERNAKLAGYNRELKNRVAQLQQETSRLRQAYQKKEVERKQLLAKKEEVDKLLGQAKEHLAAAREELQAQNTVLADVNKNGGSPGTGALNQEIATLKASIRELEQRTEQLASMSQAMAV